MEYRSLASKYATQYGVDPVLYSSLIEQESRWKPDAVSPMGARGIVQVMPDTARDPGFGVAPVQMGNVEDELRFGAEYLGTMLKKYNGDVPRALAAYNWGPGRANSWDGSYHSLPEETQKYISNIHVNSANGGFQFDMPGPNYKEPLVMRNLNGVAAPGEIERIAGAAINRSQMPAFQGIAPTSQPALTGVEEAVGRSSAGPVDLPAEGAGGFLAKIMPDLSDADRRSNLLAIGAGLLSGDDWESGFAGAANNLLNVGQQRDARNARQNDIGSGYDRIGSVMTTDGQIVGGVSYDPRTAEYFTLDQTGQRVTVPGAIPLNNSDASGSRYATLANKTAEEVRSTRSTLSSIDKLMPNIRSMEYGVPGMMTDLKGFVKTLSGRMELSEDEIIRRIASGQTNALVGKVREDVVGPGVMTEQDALRVLSALGGDATAVLGNPQVAERMLTEIYERTQRRYEELHNQYDAYRQFPGSVFQSIERYKPPSAAPGPGPLNQSNAGDGDIEDILNGYGF